MTWNSLTAGLLVADSLAGKESGTGKSRSYFGILRAFSSSNSIFSTKGKKMSTTK